jgi:methylated-DNA-[protein]-cysteine S-methyltransferase
MNSYFYETFSTPFGPFSVAVDDSSAVVATAFGDRASLASRLAPCHLINDIARLDAARKEIADYLAGKRSDFTLRLAPVGTEFQQRVWQALREIPAGATRTYGQLAAQLGNPNASRAVGRANATNPICVIVPCHRVIGADGSLTGFAFGEDIKRRLLALERVPAFAAA